MILLALALAGCGAIKLEGECTYERTVTTSYQCAPGATIEHYRVAPPEP